MEIGKQIWEGKKRLLENITSMTVSSYCVLCSKHFKNLLSYWEFQTWVLYLYNFLLLFLLSPTLLRHFTHSHIHGLFFLNYYCYICTYTFINTVSRTHLVFYMCTYVCVCVSVCVYGLTDWDWIIYQLFHPRRSLILPPQQPWIGLQLFAWG